MRVSFIEAVAARPRWAAVMACLLGLPALKVGLVLDDYFIASRLREPDGSIRWHGLLDAFSLVPRGGLEPLRELGTMPWWSAPELTLSFWRPLSALTHAVDLTLFAEAPWLMHLESLLLLAALNCAVVSWYRRLFAGESRAFGLATALFILAPGNIFAASWLANRNAVLAALFSVLCLSWHHRARRGEPRLALPSWLALTLSLLSGEIGATAVTFLIAYETCLAEGPRRERLRAVLPALAITLSWLCVHRTLGYGARGSSLYVHVLSDPLTYARSLGENLLFLAFGQWGLPIATMRLMMSNGAAAVFACLAVACLALWAPRVSNLLRKDARARFCGLATVLALLPVASTAVHDRLLVVANVTGLALVALAVESKPDLPWLRLVMNVRLGLAALLGLAYSASLWEHVRLAEEPFEHTAQAPSVREQTLVFVNAPCIYYPLMLPWLRSYRAQPVPRRVRTLAPGMVPLEIERADDRTLVMRSPEGLFQALGTYRAEHSPAPGALSPVFLAQRLNQLSRAIWDDRTDTDVALSDLSIRVLERTHDGYPSAVAFRFAESLESPRLQFLEWRDTGYVPFALPPLQGRVRLAAVIQR